MGVIRSNYLPTQSATQKAVMHQTNDGRAVIHQQNDVTELLKLNKHLRDSAAMHHESEVMNHVANIDVLAIKEWCRKRGLVKNWWQNFMRDERLLRAFLNDPENECWRTRKGKV